MHSQIHNIQFYSFFNEHRMVHYPEEYTIKPLEVTNLAGRDPVTGRVVS